MVAELVRRFGAGIAMSQLHGRLARRALPTAAGKRQADRPPHRVERSSEWRARRLRGNRHTKLGWDAVSCNSFKNRGLRPRPTKVGAGHDRRM